MVVGPGQGRPQVNLPPPGVNDYIVGFNHVTVEDFRAALTLLMDPPASGEVTRRRRGPSVTCAN